MSFIDDVADVRERKSPVRAAVKANAANIRAARDAGHPLNAIYRTLCRAGHSVGKGYSSFRGAVLYLDEHGWPGDSASVEPIDAPSVPPSADASNDLAQDARGRFVDDRNPSDF